MSDIAKLEHASTELANHVAAVVRMSNEMDGMLADAVREDMSPATRLAVLLRIKGMHDAFRLEHFRGTIASVNAVVDVADRMYQAEPLAPEEAPLVVTDGDLPPAKIADASAGGDEPFVKLADIPEETGDGASAP